ncbi:MAG TPA: hypothetical protein VGK36_12790 [Candidatus Angelobacter sp.]
MSLLGWRTSTTKKYGAWWKKARGEIGQSLWGRKMSRQSDRGAVGLNGFPERRGFALRCLHNFQNAFSAANYQTLGEIARISGMPKIAKSGNKDFFTS